MWEDKLSKGYSIKSRYCPLSVFNTNFSFEFDDKRFHSVEHFVLTVRASFYKRYDLMNKILRYSAEDIDNNGLKALWRNEFPKFKPVGNWEKIKPDVIMLANSIRVEQNPRLRETLLDTGGHRIFHGDGDGEELGGAGKGLMEVRDLIKSNFKFNLVL